MSGRARVEEEDKKIPEKLFLLDDAGKWSPATHPFIQYTNVLNAAALPKLPPNTASAARGRRRVVDSRAD